MSESKVQLEFMDTNALQECINTLKKGVNEGLLKGCYDIEYAENLIVSLNNLRRGVRNLNTFQSFVAQKIKDSNLEVEQKAKSARKLQSVPEDNEVEDAT